jgi:hypothetical protein
MHFRFLSRLVLLASFAVSASQAQTFAPRSEREEKEAAEMAAERAATTAANTLSAEEIAGGWRLLFDGKSVPGWRGLKNREFLKAGWKIENGALTLAKEIKQMGEITGGDLITAEQFGDFEFSFQWKLGVSSNSGIMYFARGGIGGARVSGCEYQIIDDVHHPDGLKGGPLKRTGALYGVLPPDEQKKVLHDPGKWNAGKIRVQGAHIEHWLNGQKVLEYDLASRELQTAMKSAVIKLPPGYGMYKFKTALVILDDGDEISLRGLKVRAITANSVAAPTAAAPAAVAR